MVQHVLNFFNKIFGSLYMFKLNFTICMVFSLCTLAIQISWFVTECI